MWTRAKLERNARKSAPNKQLGIRFKAKVGILKRIRVFQIPIQMHVFRDEKKKDEENFSKFPFDASHRSRSSPPVLDRRRLKVFHRFVRPRLDLDRDPAVHRVRMIVNCASSIVITTVPRPPYFCILLSPLFFAPPWNLSVISLSILTHAQTRRGSANLPIRIEKFKSLTFPILS